MALGDDRTNNVGDAIGRDPALQVLAKSRSHQGRQLTVVFRHLGHSAVVRRLQCRGAGRLPKVVAGVVVPMALRTSRRAFLRGSRPSPRGLRASRLGASKLGVLQDGWVLSLRPWLHRLGDAHMWSRPASQVPVGEPRVLVWGPAGERLGVAALVTERPFLAFPACA